MYESKLVKTHVSQTSEYWKRDTPNQRYTLAKTHYEETVGTGQNFRTGVSLSDYKVRISRRQDASTAYRRVEQSVRTPLATCRAEQSEVQDPYIGENSYRGVLHTPSSFPSTDATLRDIALKRLKSKIASQSGSVQIMVPVAELRELSGLVRFAANYATDLVKALVKIRKTRGGSVFKYASDAWLQWSFGIAPTLSEIDDIIGALKKFFDRPKNLRLTGTATRSWKSSSWSLDSTGCFGANMNQFSRHQHSLSYKFVGAFDFAVSTANSYTIHDHFGLGMGELIPAFWELVPYSWLVDYFTTVGGFLEDVFTAPGCNSRYLVELRKYSCDTEFEIYHKPWNGYSISSQTIGRGGFAYSDFERTPLSSIPHRALRFKSADEIGSNAVNRLLNLSSLLVSGRLNSGGRLRASAYT